MKPNNIGIKSCVLMPIKVSRRDTRPLMRGITAYPGPSTHTSRIGGPAPARAGSGFLESPGSKECPGRATSPHELHGATNQILIPGKYLCNLLLSKRFGPKILKLNFQPMTGKVKLRFSPKNRLPCLVYPTF